MRVGGWSVLVLHAAVVAAVSLWVFPRTPGMLFDGLDGSYMQTTLQHQFAATSPALGFAMNPLQGLGDLWFNFNAWLSPPHVLVHGLLPRAPASGVLFQAAVYAAHAVVLFVAVAVTMASLGMAWGHAIAGGWVLLLGLFPYFGQPLVYPIVQLQPNTALTIAVTLFAIVIVARMGRRGPGAPSNSGVDMAWLLVLLALAAHVVLISPSAVMQVGPLAALATLGLAAGADTRREAVVKLGGPALVVVVLAALGFAQFAYGVVAYTAVNVWGGEFEPTATTWYHVSILFQHSTHGLGGPLLAGVGLVGLGYSSIADAGQLKWVARAGLALVASSVLFGAAALMLGFWKGPAAVRFEAPLWGLYAAFGARVVLVALDALRVRLPGLPGKMPLGPRVLAAFALVPASLVVTVAMVNGRGGERSWSFPPSRPPMIETLHERIGLAPGRALRGRVATFQLLQEAGSTTWFKFHEADAARMRASGNDFNTVGLWYFDIPTVLEYAPTISPALYRATTRLLARPEDEQIRNVLVLRRINVPALAALGVSHIITDAPVPSLPLAATEQTHADETLYLHEIPGAIGGGASPTSVVTVGNFDAALDRIGDEGFDPHEMVAVMPPDVDGTDLDGLSKASDISVRMIRSGFEVSASAGSRALVVLPLEFSRCLIWTPRDPASGAATLFRVNALETGVLFEKQLDGELRYFTGPFWNAGCRLQDAREFRAALAP
ncbi:MAG: hypothetical protein FJW23_02890 [Acidimicrobiia bacterium]|nr:hypothetical protein [Acidimicrobiia bacterium]